MRALTLKPQWAHAICWHTKRVENRSRPIPAALIGTRIAIHAGRFVPGAWWDEVRAASGGTVPRGREPVPLIREDSDWHAPFAMRGPWEADARRMQCRAIVATAVIRPWSNGRSELWGDPAAASWWALDEVHVLEQAIPMKRGQLGLWRLPEDIAGQLEVALG